MSDTIGVRPAAATDVAQLIQFISELADYENRSYEMVADEASLQQWLFGEDPVAQAVVGFGRSIHLHLHRDCTSSTAGCCDSSSPPC